LSNSKVGNIMQKILAIYKRRLANLNTNNKSLLLLRLNSRQHLDLHTCDFITQQPSFALISQLIARKKKILLCANVESRDKNSNQVAYQLHQIRRTDNLLWEERGAKDLFIGYPFVEGKLQDDTPIRCPLLLFSVELLLENNQWYLVRKENSTIQWNTNFLLAYSHFNQVNLPDEFLEQDFEDFSKESTVFLTELYNYLENSWLELDFNVETFEEKLKYFTEHSKTDFLRWTATGKLKLQNEAVLGIFPQSNSFLLPDYENLQNNPTLPLASPFWQEHEILPKSAPFTLGEESFSINIDLKRSKKAPLQMERGWGEVLATGIYPYSIDASQEQVLQAIEQGKSVVVQGPPGTGKSQLICNIIANGIATGKRILLVCQKRAALDVVYQRLAEQNFSPFVGLVHDIQYDRRAVYEKLLAHIENITEYQRLNQGFDSLYAQNRFDRLQEEITQICEQLNHYRKALFDTSQFGIAAKELYVSTQVPKITWEYEQKELIATVKKYQFQYNDLLSFQQKINLIQQLYSKVLQIVSHKNTWKSFDFWELRLPFDTEDASLVHHLQINLANLLENNFLKNTIYLQQLSIAEEFSNYQTFTTLLQKQQSIVELLNFFQQKNYYYWAKYLQIQKPQEKKQITEYENIIQNFLEQPIDYELVDRTENGEDIATILTTYATTYQSVGSKLHWFFTAQHKKLVTQLFEKYKLTKNYENTKLLITKIVNGRRLKQAIQDLQTLYASHEIELGNWDTIEDLGHYFKNYLTDYQQVKKFTTIIFPENFWSKKLDYWQFTPTKIVAVLQELQEVLHTQQQLLNAAQSYLSEAQITLVWNKDVDNEAISLYLTTHFSNLRAIDLLKKDFSLAEKSLWQVIIQQSFKELLNPQESKHNIALSQHFVEQIRLAWLFNLEKQQPILRTSALQLSQWGEILQKNIQEQQAWSQAIVLQKAREQTYKDLIFNRLNNLLTYRELKHQVSKKKFVFPLRKLFQHHSDDIFRLMPCWLASPETVSALFQMTQLFDCVIFDEASQCFAERGIPALLRGKQVVIAGDSQQLPPLDLYRFRWEEEYDENEETNVALEVNSLLDLGEQYLPTLTLTGHYRSQSLDLIDFSNQAFYKGKLRLIPHFQSFKNQTPAIHYHKVNGYWEKNTNPVEALSVVDLLLQLLATGEESIGIITFNLQQQNLILDSIEERNIALPASVFVKNLENVQGDERNIIIFSVAYSPTLSGKMNRQFGLLSWEQGENRLNVAVTRAKKAIHLVTSIFPHQLHTEELQNNGVRYLQAYLQYALDVSSQKYKPTLPTPTTQRPTWFLKQQLLQEHPEKEALQPLLPFADFYHTDQTLWFTDDDLYYNSLSVKDFHVYLPMQLRQKGWQFRQFWSREWWLRE